MHVLHKSCIGYDDYVFICQITIWTVDINVYLRELNETPGRRRHMDYMLVVML